MPELHLNRVAIWGAKAADELSVRVSPPGRHYFKDGIGYTSEVELYRFAKNYTAKSGRKAAKFCLFYIGDSNDSAAAEAFLDSVATDIGYDEAVAANTGSDDFRYLNKFYEEAK